MQRVYRTENCTRVTLFEWYAKQSVMQLNMDEFLSRYAALRWICSPVCHTPKMLGEIDSYLSLVNRYGFYMGENEEYIEKSKKYILKETERYDQEELEAFEAEDRSATVYLLGEVDFDGPDLVDQDDFEQAVSDYFEGLFYYGRDEMPDIVKTTLRLFLIDRGVIDTSDYESDNEEEGDGSNEEL